MAIIRGLDSVLLGKIKNVSLPLVTHSTPSFFGGGVGQKVLKRLRGGVAQLKVSKINIRGSGQKVIKIDKREGAFNCRNDIDNC